MGNNNDSLAYIMGINNAIAAEDEKLVENRVREPLPRSEFGQAVAQGTGVHRIVDKFRTNKDLYFLP